MNKKYWLLSFVSLFLLIGAGCSNNENNPSKDTSSNIPSKSAMTDTFQADDNTTPKENTDTTTTVQKDQATDFVLRGEAGGNRMVRFEWDVPEELAKDAQVYRLFLDDEPNPVSPTLWWWESGPTFRFHDWTNLPLGVSHVRACVVKNNVCTVYSNDVEVEVK